MLRDVNKQNKIKLWTRLHSWLLFGKCQYFNWHCVCAKLMSNGKSTGKCYVNLMGNLISQFEETINSDCERERGLIIFLQYSVC